MSAPRRLLLLFVLACIPGAAAAQTLEMRGQIEAEVFAYFHETAPTGAFSVPGPIYLTMGALRLEYEKSGLHAVSEPVATLISAEFVDRRPVAAAVPSDDVALLTMREGYVAFQHGDVQVGAGVNATAAFLDADAPADLFRSGIYDYMLPFDPVFATPPRAWVQYGDEWSYVRASAAAGFRGARVPYLATRVLRRRIEQAWSVEVDAKRPVGSLDVRLKGTYGWSPWPQFQPATGEIAYPAETSAALGLSVPVGEAYMARLQFGAGSVEDRGFQIVSAEVERQGRRLRMLAGGGRSFFAKPDREDIRYLLGETVYGGIEWVQSPWRIRMAGLYQEGGWLVQPRLTYRTRYWQVQAELRMLDGSKRFLGRLQQHDHFRLRTLIEI